MDIVITYVNFIDPLWQKDYAETVGGTMLKRRFRDWGFLPYLLRGIEAHLPFVRKVYLVVARESQVPAWINRDNVKVVLHKDIIPEEYLPTFNSCTIELFLHRIPGLDEQFVYFNDDILPLRDCTPDTFFPGGRAAIGMRPMLFTFGHPFRAHIRNSNRLARKAAGTGCLIFNRRPQHSCQSLLRSCCEQLYSACEPEIRSSISRVRESRNLNIYLYLCYIHFLHKSVNRRFSSKFLHLSSTGSKAMRRVITAPGRDFVCINDINLNERKFLLYSRTIREALDSVLGAKSKYEL